MDNKLKKLFNTFVISAIFSFIISLEMRIIHTDFNKVNASKFITLWLLDIAYSLPLAFVLSLLIDVVFKKNEVA